MVARHAVLSYLIHCISHVAGFTHQYRWPALQPVADSYISGLYAVKSIDSTPNPLSFKLSLDQLILSGPAQTFLSKFQEGCPESVQNILALEGMDSVYVMPDWVCVNKLPASKYSWDELLPLCVTALGGVVDRSEAYDVLNKLLLSKEKTLLMSDQKINSSDSNSDSDSDEFLSIAIRMQLSCGIPIQIEASNGITIKRQALSTRFATAMDTFINKGTEDGGDKSVNKDKMKNDKMKFFEGRKWVPRGNIYAAAVEDALTTAVNDIEAIYTDNRLLSIINSTPLNTDISMEMISSTMDFSDLKNTNDKIAVRAVENICNLIDNMKNRNAETVKSESDNVPLRTLIEFVQLGTGSTSARRLALAYLGSCTGGSTSIFESYKDDIFYCLSKSFCEEKAAGLRRTAGDALSDFGDPRSVPIASEQLRIDSSKLVRWRAARILGEFGRDCSVSVMDIALGSLKAATVVEGQAFDVVFECMSSITLLQSDGNGNSNTSGTNDDKGDNNGKGKEKSMTMPEWLRQQSKK